MYDKDTAYKKISELVIRFGEQFDSYKKSEYNESLTRRDFIDPFFRALGWDINNENGYAESYREVIHEDRVKVGQGTKAPDYSFRLPGGKKLFFVEAKKPHVDIKDDIHPAYQIRRYGWSARLAISIITDFEEFSVYDCTKKPKLTDKASVSRIKYLTYKDFLNEFDFIWDAFSKEKVLKGSFDKFVQSDTNKRGTTTVDKEFLLSLDNWRTYLATSISWRNKDLDVDEINFVVQQTIDRIIFLRIAEDRGVEPYSQLKEALRSGDYYQNLFRQFERADDKYNSGLFNFKKDTISRNIVVDNKVIKNIINELYYPESPYEFSVLSVEILGSAYEQFLGKTITIDKAHRAKIEEKPEVRKAGGVYYTPQYIVEYIVQNTVGKLIEGKKPKDISGIRIVDPACGSGSFLIGAYQYLLDYHRDYYTENGKLSKGTKDNPLTPDGNLTTAEKKRILLNNLYGVDIDVNAVEVTKLSLLLKCMEGETEATIATQLKLFNERILPTLDDNIKSGNSLIDTDFYDGQLDFEPDAEKKIKPFNWQKAFPEVFKNGGFDAVIGNPPYVQIVNQSKESLNYYLSKYSANSDLYSIFIERSFLLLKTNSLLGYIVPSLFIKGVRYDNLRNLININSININLKEMGDGVFETVQMPTCIVLLQKGKNINEKDFFDNGIMNYFNKVETILLEQTSTIRRGLEIGKDKLIQNGEIKCITGSNLSRYFINYTSYISEVTFQEFYKNVEIFSSPKIIIRETGDRFYASIDYLNVINTRSIYNIKLTSTNIEYSLILGIINSKLFYFYFKQFISPETKIFPKLRIAQLRKLPIAIDIKNNYKPQITQFVDQLLQLNNEKQEVKLQTRLEQIQTKIEYCENRIDQLVYQLYGLKEEEIAIIENG
ncbi:MAG: N-6 DNA methylase [Saprospiraceae bacterium]|nr:N-6 DNA methylase [Saprospiraceae bacterium]